MNLYPEALLRIDDEMVALGRPVPPVVSWLQSKPTTSTDAKERWDEASRVWRSEFAEWETRSPESAARWLELRLQYAAEDERIEALKWSEEKFRFELLTRLGVPRRSVDAVQRPLDDRSCMRQTREWLLDGLAWSLTLCGGPGSGKTTAATWAAHQLLMRRFRPKWVRCAAMVDAPLFGIEAQLMKHQCRTADVLVLDDIGAGAREQDAKPWLGWLDDVLDARHGNRKRTIITSNLTAAKLAPWLGPRLADRLNEGVIHETAEKSMRGTTQHQQGAT